MSQPPSFDASIPVLTEVLQDDAGPAAALESRAVDGWGPQQWDALERRLSERILQQLQGRIDFVLEQRIKDSMAEVLNHALGSLTAEIRAGLRGAIEQIVTRAVSQELTQLQAQKR